MTSAKGALGESAATIAKQINRSSWAVRRRALRLNVLLAQVRRGAEGEGQMTGPRPAGPLRYAELFQHRPEYPIPKRRADAEVLSGDFVVADVVPQ